MSDLQCAATLLLAGVRGDDDAAALGTSLQDRRVAVVYTDDAPGTGDAVGALSRALAAPVRSEPDLREGLVSPAEVLEQLADQHRGETVLVLAAAETLERLLGSRGGVPSVGAAAEVRIDADGWAFGS
ncbi:MAG: histidine phosphatase family protein [Actinomycetota bacterium]|nr:histidine phosphatase family protein [Actinomycetota bacterium]